MKTTTSRFELIFRGLAYLLLSAAGVWILFDTPYAVQGWFEPFVTFALGSFMMTSIIAAIASFHGRYRVEMSVLPLLFSGLTLYSIMISIMAASVESSRVPQALTLISFSLVIVVRYIQLMNLARREPVPDTEQLPTIEELPEPEDDIVTAQDVETPTVPELIPPATAEEAEDADNSKGH